VADDVVISAQNVYNPFGIDFGGGDGVNPNLRLRLESVGPRHSRVVSNSTVANTGLRGELFGTGWQWISTSVPATSTRTRSSTVTTSSRWWLRRPARRSSTAMAYPPAAHLLRPYRVAAR